MKRYLATAGRVASVFLFAVMLLGAASTAEAANSGKFTLKNNTGHDVRVFFYHTNDSSQLISYGQIQVKNGKSGSKDLSALSGKVTIKVFKKQLIDKLVLSKAGLEYNGSFKLDKSYNLTGN